MSGGREAERDASVTRPSILPPEGVGKPDAGSAMGRAGRVEGCVLGLQAHDVAGGGGSGEECGAGGWFDESGGPEAADVGLGVEAIVAKVGEEGRVVEKAEVELEGGRVGEVDEDEVQAGGGETARKTGLGDPCRGRSWMRHPSLAPWGDRPISFRACLGRGKMGRCMSMAGACGTKAAVCLAVTSLCLMAGFKGSFMSDLRGRDKWQPSIKVSARGREPFGLVKPLQNRLC
jgi:hypothetical protein